jgi:hypothetical protein
MDTFHGFPGKYPAAACTVLTFLLFAAGGVAFSQGPFYRTVFFIIVILLFFAGAYFGSTTAARE